MTGEERRGDKRKEEEIVLQNMHQLQEVGEHTLASQIRLLVSLLMLCTQIGVL